MEPNVFLGYPDKGTTCVLSSFGHEQYPSKSIDPWCLIIEYLNEGIGFLAGFGRVTIPFHISKYMLWNPMYFCNIMKGVIHIY
jgi:hypothetical protein